MYGLTDDQTWFYTPSTGWLGTTKEIWEPMTETSNYLWLWVNRPRLDGLPIILSSLQVDFLESPKPKLFYLRVSIQLVLKIAQLAHSIDLSTGGVAKAIIDLGKAFTEEGVNNISIVQNNELDVIDVDLLIAHGLWQWPGSFAYKLMKEKVILTLSFPMA